MFTEFRQVWRYLRIVLILKSITNNNHLYSSFTKATLSNFTKTKSYSKMTGSIQYSVQLIQLVNIWNVIAT